MEAHKASYVESSSSPDTSELKPGRKGWIRVGAIAAASALAGGLAAAWYYRKTLHTLREAESLGEIPDFGISQSETPADD